LFADVVGIYIFEKSSLMSLEPPFRKIIHVDMDAFFASVEQLDQPELRGIPLAVGGGGKRGVVAAASYEARAFGVRSAMSGIMASRLCPQLIFVPPRFERYKEVSAQISTIFRQHTDLVEPLSLDEAYLDVTHHKKGNPSASLIASEIRTEILKLTGLHASAGISINKFVAKIASDINKPNGQKTIPPEEVLSFLENLDIRKFFGIGKVTADKMYGLGIFTGADLKLKSEDFLETHFGKSGRYFYRAVRGVHHSEVSPERIQKSVGAERTFNENISSEVFLEGKIIALAEELSKRLGRSKLSGKTITLKLKYADFNTQTRSKTLPYFIANKDLIIAAATELLYQEVLSNSVRLLGISMGKLNNEKKEAIKGPPVSVQLNIDF
jgi:DNA polymerase IV|tara:strand:+ start:8039 stop:9184 length:1146 start_codon:yes stop_codon:yes gene_type:complete